MFVFLMRRRPPRSKRTDTLLPYMTLFVSHSIDPAFSSTTVSLLDRGMVYAIAHSRGGQEMGRQWYDDGTLLRRKNTFTDFIDGTAHLVAEAYVAPDPVPAHAGRAGGLTMGARATMTPDRYAGTRSR